MAGLFSIIVPEATTNYALNGSFEAWTSGVPTGWTSFGTPTITQTSTTQRYGAYSARVQNPSTQGDRGIYRDHTSVTNGTSYHISVYVNVATGTLRMIAYDGGGFTNAIAATSSGTGWQRLELDKTATAGGIRVGLWAFSAGSDGYYDGLQIEAKSYATTYCDGDHDGCTWTGTAHASTSTRDAQYRGGGRIVNFDSYSAYILGMQGSGAPTEQTVIQDYALLPGGRYLRSRDTTRTMTLTCQINPGTGATQNTLHNKRKAFLDLFKPDAYKTQQPARITYDGGTAETMALDVIYDAGLEFGVQDGFTEKFGLRLLSPNPYWFELHDSAAAPSVQVNVSGSPYILQRATTGVWGGVGTGLSGGSAITIITVDEGAMYVGGSFTSAGGVANTANIAKWNGSAWSAMGTGSNNTVQTLAVGPDGTIYAGGQFTSMGGVANTTRVARWNGSAWSAMGTGANDTVAVLTVGPDGSVYAGGAFTSMSGVANTAYIAKWNGSAWSALATGVDANVNDIVIGLDGSLYAGGVFSNAGVTPVKTIARWNGSAWSALGTGLTGSISGFPPSATKLIIGPDGSLYAAGVFTTAGGVTCNQIARWDGANWGPVGTGFSATILADIRAISYTPDGKELWITGNFTSVGGISTPDGVGRWNGASWYPSDFTTNSNPTVPITALAFSAAGVLTISPSTTNTPTTASVTTVTNNGTTNAYPILTLTASSTNTSIVYQLVNYTTGDAIYFNITLNASEKLTLDLRPGKKTFTSSFRGNVINKILPGSNLASWRLMPGDNKVSLYCSDSGTTATLVWVEQHLSIDGGAA